MGKSEPTPLPWVHHNVGSTRICDGAHDSVHGCSTIAEAEIIGVKYDTAVANAALIVRAVNEFIRRYSGAL